MGRSLQTSRTGRVGGNSKCVWGCVWYLEKFSKYPIKVFTENIQVLKRIKLEQLYLKNSEYAIANKS